MSETKKAVNLFTQKNLMIAIGLAVAGGIVYKTKGFGLFVKKGQSDVDPSKQDNIVFVQNSDGSTTTQQANNLTDSEATNLAIDYHDTLGEAWGFWGYMYQSPSEEDYVRVTKKLYELSGAQLAQVVNKFNAKYKGDTYNTIRKLANAVTVTGQSWSAKNALIAKLDQIGA